MYYLSQLTELKHKEGNIFLYDFKPLLREQKL